MKTKRQPILYHGIPIVGRMPLFTFDNRQAIRDDQKGQTRRIMDPPPLLFPGWWKGLHWASEHHFRKGVIEHYLYKIGDVRCMCEPLVLGLHGLAYYRDAITARLMDPVISLVTGKPLIWRWKRDYLASIHMPTEAARTICKITDIRVERLQEIGPEDAIREGYPFDLPPAENREVYIDWFHNLWDSINEAKGYGWDVPQMVWVNMFKRIKDGE